MGGLGNWQGLGGLQRLAVCGCEREGRQVGGLERLAPLHSGVWAGVECAAVRWVCEGVCLQRKRVGDFLKEEGKWRRRRQWVLVMG